MNLVTLVRGNRVPERRPLTIDTYSSVARRCYDIFLLLIIDYFSSKLSRVSGSCSNEHYLYGYYREELYLLEDKSDENLFFLFFLRLLRVALFQTLIYCFFFRSLFGLCWVRNNWGSDLPIETFVLIHG